MANYYNEFDAYPAQWLRNLINVGFLPPGDVDTRSIKDVKPDDLKGYTQCHFFAGIGGWSAALSLAGWPEDKPVWTGSCPCQPFSVAGKQKAQSDDRHLWAEWYRLISEHRPATIFGEQVGGAIAHGWLDDVYQGLESQGYVVGAALLPATSVGAPHRRERLWFVADARRKCNEFQRESGNGVSATREMQSEAWQQRFRVTSNDGCKIISNANCKGSFPTTYGGIHSVEESTRPRHEQFNRYDSHVPNANCKPSGRFAESWGECGFWEFEPGMGRVANGVSARVGRLRAYGNAIVPQVAAEFIRAFIDTQRP